MFLVIFPDMHDRLIRTAAIHDDAVERHAIEYIRISRSRRDGRLLPRAGLPGLNA
jgi:hypothetical protein